MRDTASSTAYKPKGREPGWRKPPPPPRPDSSTNVFDIDRWCLEGDCSRTWLHEEWKAGRGPKRVRLGKGKVKIFEPPREYFERVAHEQVAAKAAPVQPVVQPSTQEMLRPGDPDEL